MNLLDPLFRWEAVDKLFSDDATLQRMLDFEAALARAETKNQLIPEGAAKSIEAHCKAARLDRAKLAEAAALAGNLAIPLIKQLTALVGQDDKEAARYVHWGSTSQDVIDTARILQLRDALDLVAKDLAALADTFSQVAHKHRSTIVTARTWMQHALPTTLGVKVAGWLDAIDRHRERLHQVQKRCLALQFGGAVGTLAALETRGPDVAKDLAAEMGLSLPTLPWHSHRDRMAEVATTLGLCVGTLGKIAKDISLHTQTEIAEIFEPFGDGRGGSSTMPHKQNPVTSAVVLAAAARIPGLVAAMLSAEIQEDERGLGGWHAEWETLPEIVRLTAGALHHLVEIAPHIKIDQDRMRLNLDATRGLIFAEAVTMELGGKIGRAQAHEILEAATREAQNKKMPLRDVLLRDSRVTAHLSVADLDRLFNPQNYLGAAEVFVDKAVAGHKLLNAHLASASRT
jgi:3-carboxy-cis,cis-muconate cycloisomerase